MKTKKVLLTALCATAITVATCPPLAAFAAGTKSPVLQNEAGEISPRYTYIRYADLGFDATDGSYDLTIDATTDVTKITGTLTLYKLNSSSKYVKIDSTTIKVYSNELMEFGSLSNDGEGRYKLTFSGRVYAGTASEPITISVSDSY